MKSTIGRYSTQMFKVTAEYLLSMDGGATIYLKGACRLDSTVELYRVYSLINYGSDIAVIIFFLSMSG